MVSNLRGSISASDFFQYELHDNSAKMQTASLLKLEPTDFPPCLELGGHACLKQVGPDYPGYQKEKYYLYLMRKDEPALHAISYAYSSDAKIGILVQRSSQRENDDDVWNVEEVGLE